LGRECCGQGLRLGFTITHVQEARLNHKIFAREKRPAII
jgi:hypothetical protein